jgi:hypothetical protein
MNEHETRRAVQDGVTDSIGAFIKGAFIVVCAISFFKTPFVWAPWLAVFGLVYGIFTLADSKNKITAWIGGAILSIIGFAFALSLIGALLAALYFVISVMSAK